MVNNRIIGHPLLIPFSLLAIYETYITNIAYINNGIISNIVRQAINQLSQVEEDLNSVVDFCDPWGWRPLNTEDKASRDILLTNIDRKIGEVISLDELGELPRKIDDDVFFEELNRNINSYILKLQKNSSSRDTDRIKLLNSELLVLKSDFERNFEHIRSKEYEISTIYENELKDKVQNYVKDDILMNEKMCPKFLQLAKSGKSESMAVIKDSDGNNFSDTKSRSEFIRNFYNDLYKVPDNAVTELDGCVERFLGEEICSNPTVLAMKLSPDEKVRLDQKITLSELDRALETSNKKSAPGIDGSVAEPEPVGAGTVWVGAGAGVKM